MLQFLVSDYLIGYDLPSLRKSVIDDVYGAIWTLTSERNTYEIKRPYDKPFTIVSMRAPCRAVAIRIAVDFYDNVVSLLEDGSEWVSDEIGYLSSKYKVGTTEDYLE